MSFNDLDEFDPEDELDSIANEHGIDRDVLGQYEDQYADKQAFKVWWAKDVAGKGLSANTTDKYEMHVQQWLDYMAEQGRHPALPAPKHVRGYIEYLCDEKGNSPDYIKNQLYPVQRAFNFFARESSFNAHDPDTNLIKHIKQEIDLSDDTIDEFPPLDLSDVREFVADVGHIRDRLVIVLQLKLGLRAGTVANIQLQDIHLSNDLHDHYDQLGTHPQLADYDRTQAIHVPADREGTKSKNSRTLPLDTETRRLLTQYLLIRPDIGADHLILSTEAREPVGYRAITDIWNKRVKPRFDTDEYRAVTSHFGRHFFTDYWGVEQDINTHLLQYMRGDTVQTDGSEGKNGVDHYLHPEYSDIENLYREEVYRLLV